MLTHKQVVEFLTALTSGTTVPAQFMPVSSSKGGAGSVTSLATSASIVPVLPSSPDHPLWGTEQPIDHDFDCANFMTNSFLQDIVKVFNVDEQELTDFLRKEGALMDMKGLIEKTAAYLEVAQMEDPKKQAYLQRLYYCWRSLFQQFNGKALGIKLKQEILTDFRGVLLPMVKANKIPTGLKAMLDGVLTELQQGLAKGIGSKEMRECQGELEKHLGRVIPAGGFSNTELAIAHLEQLRIEKVFDFLCYAYGISPVRQEDYQPASKKWVYPSSKWVSPSGEGVPPPNWNDVSSPPAWWEEGKKEVSMFLNIGETKTTPVPRISKTGQTLAETLTVTCTPPPRATN